MTSYENVIKGFKVDFILYANNYEEVDAQHPLIEMIDSVEKALEIFREGAVMSKGTTTTTGLVRTYFANVFGPQQNQVMHEILARQYFEAFYRQKLFIGQIRTRLGIAGKERKGPEEAAKELLQVLVSQEIKVIIR